VDLVHLAVAGRDLALHDLDRIDNLDRRDGRPLSGRMSAIVCKTALTIIYCVCTSSNPAVELHDAPPNRDHLLEDALQDYTVHASGGTMDPGPTRSADANDPELTRAFADVSGPAVTLGPYRLLQKLGEGGMGEIWLADQVQPIRRQVAIKVIKAGMDTAQVVARFESERQALAVMDHPAIARVFDAGSTPAGRPYFAMEYVRGEPIITYCDRHHLTTDERLQLFLQVCDGVQHAHQKAIIHRDLKPSNILVTLQNDRPAPKIIDFGLAKAITPQLSDRWLVTEVGALVGTPEYMSPEQAEMGGLDIDTRTDVYALGVTLYELLTGCLPHEAKDLRQLGLDEIRRTIREVDPLRPSARAAQRHSSAVEIARNRQTAPERLARRLRGDLDWIVMRALEKDRTRRYQTANALALDIRRSLNSEPVTAGPPGSVYRIGKFVCRHRLGVTAAGVLATLLVAFGATMAVQARRIARERDRANTEAVTARQVADFLVGLFTVSDPSEARGKSVTAREILDKGAREIDETLRDQPEVQARLQATMGAVYTSLGMYGAALPLLERAVETRRRLLGYDDPDTLAATNDLANAYWYQGRLKEAEPLYLDIVERRKRVLGEEHPDTLRARFDLASVYGQQRRWDIAETLTRSTLDTQVRVLGEDHPDTVASITHLQFLYYRQGRYSEAEPIAARALQITRRVMGEDHPRTLNDMHNLATIYDKLGRYGEAERLYLQSLEGLRRVLGEVHPEIASTFAAVALLYKNLGRYADAEPMALAAYRAYNQSLGVDHERTQEAVGQLGALYDAWGRPAQATEWRAKRLTPAPGR
jgi:non-specific serine/threonine protein kinase/serine/threonine-protein kinase